MNKFPTLADFIFCRKCISCLETLPLFSGKDFCEKCEKQVSKLENKDFTLLNADKVKSLFYYSGAIREALTKFKYHNFAQAGKVLGKELAQDLKKDPDFMSADIIVNVPNGKYDTERLYNQSELLAKVVSKECGIPFCPNVLKKKRNIKSQVKCKSYTERKENVKDVFSAVKGIDLSDKTVMIIDDITTTGSTLNECAKALKKAGAKTVYGATVARPSITMPKSKIKLLDADIVFLKKPTVHYKFSVK